MEEIAKENLKAGCMYMGISRFCNNCGMWNGNKFLGFQLKFGKYLFTSDECGETGFSPYILIDDEIY